MAEDTGNFGKNLTDIAKNPHVIAAAHAARDGDMDGLERVADMGFKSIPEAGPIIAAIEALGGHNIVHGFVENAKHVFDDELSTNSRLMAGARLSVDINPVTSAFGMLGHAFDIGTPIPEAKDVSPADIGTLEAPKDLPELPDGKDTRSI